MTDVERCVICNEIIPEGSQVCTACQKKGTHAGSHSKTNGGNIAFNILHGIIDRHAGCYGTARAVDIQLNIFTRIFCFQEKKL